MQEDRLGLVERWFGGTELGVHISTLAGYMMAQVRMRGRGCVPVDRTSNHVRHSCHWWHAPPPHTHTRKRPDTHADLDALFLFFTVMSPFLTASVSAPSPPPPPRTHIRNAMQDLNTEHLVQLVTVPPPALATTGGATDKALAKKAADEDAACYLPPYFEKHAAEILRDREATLTEEAACRSYVTCVPLL